MLTVLILVVFVVVALVLILLASRCRRHTAGTARNGDEDVAPSLIAVVVRRLLGVYLRRPTPPADSHKEWPTTAWTETTSRPSGGRR